MILVYKPFKSLSKTNNSIQQGMAAAERVFEMMCKRAVSRQIDEDGKTLATRQIIQAWVAEARAEIDAALAFHGLAQPFDGSWRS